MLSVFYCYPFLTEILYPLLNRVTHTRPGLDTLSAVGKNLSYHLLKSWNRRRLRWHQFLEGWGLRELVNSKISRHLKAQKVWKDRAILPAVPLWGASDPLGKEWGANFWKTIRGLRNPMMQLRGPSLGVLLNKWRRCWCPRETNTA